MEHRGRVYLLLALPIGSAGNNGLIATTQQVELLAGIRVDQEPQNASTKSSANTTGGGTLSAALKSSDNSGDLN